MFYTQRMKPLRIFKLPVRLKITFLLSTLFFIFGCPPPGPYIKVGESIEELQNAVLADTNDPVAYYNLGLGYTADKQYEEALEYFHKSLEIAPHFSDAYFAIFCVEYAKDKKLYHKALEEEQDPEIKRKIYEIDSYLHFASMYDPFFDWKLSTILLERRPYSDNPFIQMRINRIYDCLVQFSIGNYEKAVEKSDRLIEETPEFRLAYLIRGIAQAQLQKYEEAIEDFRFLIDKLEEYNKEKVLPIYLNPAELYYWIGCAHLKQENLDKAEETFKKVILENMGFYMAHYQLSNVYQQKGNYVEALRELDATIIARPDDPIFHYYKGVYLSNLSRDWEAMQEYQRAISINPKFPNPYYHLATVLESVKNDEGAVENYKNFIDRAPKQLNSFIEKAQSRIEELEKGQIMPEN